MKPKGRKLDAGEKVLLVVGIVWILSLAAVRFL